MRRVNTMNPIAEEMKAILEGDENTLMHYGRGHLDGGHSGRYKWGSGDDPYQHDTADFLGRVEKMRKEKFIYVDEDGKTWTGDTAIAKSMGLTTTNFRTELTLAKNERRSAEVAEIKRLSKQGMGATEIGKILGKNESSIRSLLNAESESRMNKAKETAEFIKGQIETKGMIDVGNGVERELGISKEKLNEALYLLERDGYPIYKGGIPQPTNPGQQTNQRVICPKGTEHKEIYNYDKIHTLKEYTSHDDGETFDKFVYPKSMDSKRLMIRYKEDGGIEKDGIIELRRGVDDLSLGESRYSQVRILVDGTHYLKGMAVYSDDMPDGIDVIFNTNKGKDKSKMEVLKEIKNDPDNPFGSAIKPNGQSYYIDKNGKRQLSLINKRADEGDWDEWSNALPAQFLSKQSLNMAQKQLDIASANKKAEYEAICELTNPTIKKHLLNKFASECDSAAVHLKAAALPGQKYHVIIPITSMKDNEVYAPNYEDGTKLALIRYPHGGTFEIPILTVNNKHAAARKLLGNDVIDAVGINSKVAERLSGADFDGDTVMCIPTHDRQGKVKITSTDRLKELEGFDPKSYQYEGDPVIDSDGNKHYYRNGKEFRIMRNTQTEMGVISNLITDMTLKGASTDELARAVRHSMVVIDAEKHKLDYKQSELDNGIASLKKEYQQTVGPDGKVRTGGASTLISRSKGEAQVLKRQGTPKVNLKGTEWYDPNRPEGALIYKNANDLEYTVTKTNRKTGEVTTITKYRTQKSRRMAETDDARTLISDANTPMERAYANYANQMKSLANQARKEEMTTGKIEYNKAAKEAYSTEVKSLMYKLNTALLNSPRERHAMRMANAEVNAKTKAYEEEHGEKMKSGDVKKLRQQAISKYRKEVESSSRRDRNIEITDREWDAIQAGAISENKLLQILNNADIDKLRQRATPKSSSSKLNDAKINQIKAMSSSYTLKQIADKLGISTSTVSKYLKGVN